MDVDIGIEEDARKELAEGLSALLADTSTLYMKTLGYHWNVVGPMFHSLHLMFEQQYVELREAMDVIAERVRALGSLAPGSYAELARLSSVPD
jgi:starvation-inducible DNA-binding protein